MVRYCLLLLFVFAAPAFAGEASIVDVRVNKQGEGAYSFDVTVRHGDEGWKHYADGWDILAPDGTVLGHRKLWHPHVDEQPFTRSLGGVAVPAGIDRVRVRVHDSVHGYSKTEKTVKLP